MIHQCGVCEQARSQIQCRGHQGESHSKRLLKPEADVITKGVSVTEEENRTRTENWEISGWRDGNEDRRRDHSEVGGILAETQEERVVSSKAEGQASA